MQQDVALLVAERGQGGGRGVVTSAGALQDLGDLVVGATAATSTRLSTWVPVLDREKIRTSAPYARARPAMSFPMPYEPPKTTMVLPASRRRYSSSLNCSGRSAEAS